MFNAIAFALFPHSSFAPECFKCTSMCADETHFEVDAWYQENHEDPRILHAAVQDVLAAWGLVAYLPKFFSPDGLVVVALLCNAAAKFFDEEFYGWKPHLIRFASKMHSHCWQDDGVVYFETCVGQISFHTFEGEGDLLPAPNGRQWRGGWMQDHAREIAQAFLAGGDDSQIEYEFSTWLEGAQS